MAQHPKTNELSESFGLTKELHVYMLLNASNLSNSLFYLIRQFIYFACSVFVSCKCLNWPSEVWPMRRLFTIFLLSCFFFFSFSSLEPFTIDCFTKELELQPIPKQKNRHEVECLLYLPVIFSKKKNGTSAPHERQSSEQIHRIYVTIESKLAIL